MIFFVIHVEKTLRIFRDTFHNIIIMVVMTMIESELGLLEDEREFLPGSDHDISPDVYWQRISIPQHVDRHRTVNNSFTTI